MSEQETLENLRKFFRAVGYDIRLFRSCATKAKYPPDLMERVLAERAQGNTTAAPAPRKERV